MFDLNDPFFKERPLDLAFRITRARSRCAVQLCFRNPRAVLERLDNLGHTARVRAIGAVFGWSKPTVMKFVRLGLLLRKRRPRGSPSYRPIEIEVWTARWLVGLCERVFRDPPEHRHEHSRVRRRLAAEGTDGNFNALGPRLSVTEMARFLRCNPITVLRMVESGALPARRRTRCRWEFRKKDLPWWCREKN